MDARGFGSLRSGSMIANQSRAFSRRASSALGSTGGTSAVSATGCNGSTGSISAFSGKSAGAGILLRFVDGLATRGALCELTPDTASLAFRLTINETACREIPYLPAIARCVALPTVASFTISASLSAFLARLDVPEATPPPSRVSLASLPNSPASSAPTSTSLRCVLSRASPRGSTGCCVQCK